MKKFMTMLKGLGIFSIVSWYLYGLSDGLLRTAKVNKEVAESNGALETYYEPAIIQAFRNFEEFFRTMKEV